MSYKIICPECGGHNFYVTPENGKSFCFNCRYFEQENSYNEVHARIRSEYIDSIRKYYTELAAYYHSCLGEKERRYLLERGITDRTIQNLKIGFCPSSSHVLYLSLLAQESGIADAKYKPFLANRIVFPYWFDGYVTDIRGRTLNNNDSDIKYKSPYKSAFYRGADYAYQIKVEPSKTLVVTEGEIKSIIPQQEGLQTVGLPGMNSFRKISIASCQKIVLCFDNQRQKRRELLLSIKTYAEKLNQDVYIATLPLRNKEKQDIDSYIITYGVDAYKKVIQNAVPYKTWLRYAY